MKTKYVLTAIMAAVLLMFAAGSAQAREKNRQDEYCREYTKTIRIGGDLRVGYGTACYKPDGAWEIVSTRGNIDAYEMNDYIYQSLSRRERDVVVISDHYRYGPPGHYKNYYQSHYKNYGDRGHRGHHNKKRSRGNYHHSRNKKIDHDTYIYFKF